MCRVCSVRVTRKEHCGVYIPWSLLSVIGARSYSLLRELLAPEKPEDESLEDLFKKLKSHYEPKPLVIVERFHFHHRDQGAREQASRRVHSGATATGHPL